MPCRSGIPDPTYPGHSRHSSRLSSGASTNLRCCPWSRCLCPHLTQIIAVFFDSPAAQIYGFGKARALFAAGWTRREHCITCPSYIVPYLLVCIRKAPIELVLPWFYPQGVRAFRSDQGVELAHVSAHVAAEPRAAPTNQSDVAEDVGHGINSRRRSVPEGRGKHCQPLPGVTRNNVVSSRALSWANNSHRACPRVARFPCKKVRWPTVCQGKRMVQKPLGCPHHNSSGAWIARGTGQAAAPLPVAHCGAFNNPPLFTSKYQCNRPALRMRSVP